MTLAERARIMARRKELYEEKYPEARHGGDRKSIKSKQVRLDPAPERFAAATAAAIGKVERVRRDLATPPSRSKPDPDAAYLGWMEDGQNLYEAAHRNRSFARTVLLSSLAGHPIGRHTRAFT
jgi:hypothetical protein